MVRLTITSCLLESMKHLVHIDDIYGPSKLDPQPATNGLIVGSILAKKRFVTRLSLCDMIPAHGPISSMTFALAKNGVSLRFPHLAIALIVISGPLCAGTRCCYWVWTLRWLLPFPGL
jgi:hypothetical protein